MIDLDAFLKHLEEVAKRGGSPSQCIVSYENYKKVLTGEIPCPCCGTCIRKKEKEKNETS